MNSTTFSRSARTRRVAQIAAVVAAGALTLSACGGGGDNAGDAPQSVPEPVEVGSAERSPEQSAPAENEQQSDDGQGDDRHDDQGQGQGGQEQGGLPGYLPPKPAYDDCVDVPPQPSGEYQVYEAGTAQVVREGNRLVLRGVQPSEGWRQSVDSRDRDEVEIEFRKGREQLDLEVELDDGRVEVQICNDDD
ncbi:hypothetical protein BJF85_20855 [Saccharomonospora sp. CUA-673]|uniref:hypothetical protein n=1 Tax=Saccharomonospora sp. CUA-673 TaxID=1904969 RepID=UPI00095F0032|nr:hypothetical protein [Saccharomonospora sp. CUA-673]OLT43992.1 hypothetical protein BJF85_20855 [Saccharomonospora sp. CUA-673]